MISHRLLLIYGEVLSHKSRWTPFIAECLPLGELRWHQVAVGESLRPYLSCVAAIVSEAREVQCNLALRSTRRVGMIESINRKLEFLKNINYRIN
jgi:hypothetical protein